MRIEKLSYRSFESSIVEGAARRSFMPPSLVPEPEALPPAPPPAPTYSDEDLKRAEQEGYRKGFLEGTKEGQMQAQSEQADIHRQLTGVVETLAEKLRGMIDTHNALLDEQRSETPKLALAIARKVAGEALDENPLPAVQAVALETLSRLIGEPRIVITVHESLAATLEEQLVARFAENKDPGEITIRPDPDMDSSDCRIDWLSGSAERDTEKLWRDIEEIIQAMSGNKKMIDNTMKDDTKREGDDG